MYVRTPVELGLKYMIRTRLEWMMSEKKAEVVVEDVKELCFETKPTEVLQRLNDKKCKLLDFLQISLKMVIEEKDVFIQGEQAILGSVKEKVGTLSSAPTGWSELPSSLQIFEVAVLIGDLIQKDARRNKTEYHLRQTSAEDQVILQWVCTQDLQLIDQKRRDIELVQLSQSIDNISIPAGPSEEKGREVEKPKIQRKVMMEQMTQSITAVTKKPVEKLTNDG